MTGQSSDTKTARPALPTVALAFSLLVAAVPLAAASSLSPMAPPRAPMLAPTAVERALAAWRHSRGLDGARSPLLRPGAVPIRAQDSGNPDDAQWQAKYGLPIPDG